MNASTLPNPEKRSLGEHPRSVANIMPELAGKRKDNPDIPIPRRIDCLEPSEMTYLAMGQQGKPKPQESTRVWF